MSILSQIPFKDRIQEFQMNQKLDFNLIKTNHLNAPKNKEKQLNNPDNANINLEVLPEP
jgi:hypothetical protein